MTESLERKAYILAEKLQGNALALQEAIKYDLNNEETDISGSIDHFKSKAERNFEAGEELLESRDETEPESERDVCYSFHEGTASLGDETGRIELDLDQLGGSVAKAVNAHQYAIVESEASELSGFEKLRQAINDYKLLAWSAPEYNLRGSMDIPSTKRNGAEILDDSVKME